MKHILVSSHSLLLLAILIGALAIGGYGYSNKDLLPFLYILLVLPLASIVASFAYLRASKWLHLAHTWNFVALIWTFFIGSMAVTGEWI